MSTLIVSNRLPITTERRLDGIRTSPSAGGLATGLCLRKGEESWWAGWPGDLGVDLAGYERIANGMLWPLFHYFPEQLPVDISDLPTYQAVGVRFAAAVDRIDRPGDRISVLS